VKAPAALAMAGLVLIWAGAAHAQRAGEDALAGAEDAFGATVGNESVGLYGAYDARGFSPAQAGNVRIDGLYFDQQTGLNGRVAGGSDIHVGISAQAYPFPAPTGVADFHLRVPGDKPLVSGLVSYGAFDTLDVEVDGQYPVIPGRLSIGLGAGVIRIDNVFAVKNVDTNFGALARLDLARDARVTAFWSREEDCRNKQQPVVFTGGDYLPPRYPLRRFFGQDWTIGSCIDTNYGVIGRFAIGDGWLIRAGLFRSLDVEPRGFGDFLFGVQPNGAGDHQIVAVPAASFGSYSGEFGASRAFTTGRWRHRLGLAARGREVRRSYGAGDVRDFGQGFVGVRTLVPEPAFAFGPLNHEETRQGTVGLSYDGLWTGVGQVGFGVQKTFYRHVVDQPGFPRAVTNADPLLFNLSSSLFLGQQLALYASLTRGLEESGTAPGNAVNRGQAMPASITEQIDAGVRYALTPHLKLVAGLFQVEKPYFNLNRANVFGPLGQVRHRGLEVSLAGPAAPGLTVVAGAVLIDPKVTGEPVARGLVGPVPVGPSPLTGLVTLQYQPASWRGFSVDGQVVHGAAQVATLDNALKVPAWTQLNLGARYGFKIKGVPTSLRAQVSNLTNAFSWGISSNGSFFTRTPRNYRLTLAADF
jgi:iron complex outermembrane receptor protein